MIVRLDKTIFNSYDEFIEYLRNNNIWIYFGTGNIEESEFNKLDNNTSYMQTFKQPNINKIGNSLKPQKNSDVIMFTHGEYLKYVYAKYGQMFDNNFITVTNLQNIIEINNIDMLNKFINKYAIYKYITNDGKEYDENYIKNTQNTQKEYNNILRKYNHQLMETRDYTLFDLVESYEDITNLENLAYLRDDLDEADYNYLRFYYSYKANMDFLNSINRYEVSGFKWKDLYIDTNTYGISFTIKFNQLKNIVTNDNYYKYKWLETYNNMDILIIFDTRAFNGVMTIKHFEIHENEEDLSDILNNLRI